jgi:hypothetical protein
MNPSSSSSGKYSKSGYGPEQRSSRSSRQAPY